MTLEVTIVYKHGFLIEFVVYLFIKKIFLPLVGVFFFFFKKTKKNCIQGSILIIQVTWMYQRTQKIGGPTLQEKGQLGQRSKNDEQVQLGPNLPRSKAFFLEN